MLPRVGGQYAYFREAFHPLIGFLHGWSLLLIIQSGATAAVAGQNLGAGHADLAPGDRRIFRFGQADPDDGWVLAVFSVPEDHRHHRHQLRTQLGWLGFGTVGPGVWVAPAALEEPARDLLTAGDLDGYVTWFRASTVRPPDVPRWWDLGALRRHYETFLATWQRRRLADLEA